jgi:hypothetical protein
MGSASRLHHLVLQRFVRRLSFASFFASAPFDELHRRLSSFKGF